jgi:hypothetical protein
LELQGCHYIVYLELFIILFYWYAIFFCPFWLHFLLNGFYSPLEFIGVHLATWHDFNHPWVSIVNFSQIQNYLSLNQRLELVCHAYYFVLWLLCRLSWWYWWCLWLKMNLRFTNQFWFHFHINHIYKWLLQWEMINKIMCLLLIWNLILTIEVNCGWILLISPTSGFVRRLLFQIKMRFLCWYVIYITCNFNI